MKKNKMMLFFLGISSIFILKQNIYSTIGLAVTFKGRNTVFQIVRCNITDSDQMNSFMKRIKKDYALFLGICKQSPIPIATGNKIEVRLDDCIGDFLKIGKNILIDRYNNISNPISDVLKLLASQLHVNPVSPVQRVNCFSIVLAHVRIEKEKGELERWEGIIFEKMIPSSVACEGEIDCSPFCITHNNGMSEIRYGIYMSYKEAAAAFKLLDNSLKKMKIISFILDIPHIEKYFNYYH